jgi:pimeloyl-ACP methyl ester carboxylesterase
VRHYPKQNPVLRDLLPTITTPTQIVGGRDDDLVPWSNNQYLDDSSRTARSIHSTSVTSHGSKQPRNTAAWSSTGSAADIGAS